MKPEPREERFAPELNELLEQRAARVREKPREVEEDEASLLHVAEFPVGEETWAIPLSVLRAAVPLRSVTPVPLSPPHVIGILRFQGQIVTALSLASLLGGRGWREDPAVLLVVDAGGGHLVAVDCERIPKPTTLPHVLVAEARSRNPGAVVEVTLPNLKQVQLLDLPRLIARTPQEVRRA
jgi:purine-binding chemotaxis protein CheW